MPPVHDYVIDNSTGANVRSDINNALAAIVSNNSSSSQPTTRYAYMWWADTTTGILKIRNSANDGWVELLQLDGTLTLEDGSASTPGLAFRDDLNTGIFSSAADTFNVATGGVERMELGATTIFNEDGANVDFRIEGDTEANLFYLDAGQNRIGIGTSAPATLLEVKDTGSSVAISITADNASTSSLNLGDEDDINIGRVLYDHSNNSMQFNANNSERMRIDSSGNVGIGVTPTARLHVYKVGHYTVTDSGKATHGIHVRGANGNAGEFGGGISFSCGDGDSSAAIAARQGGSDADFTGMSFFTHPSGVAADDAVEKVRIHHSGETSFNDGICLGNGLTLSSAHTLEDYEEGTFTMHFNVEGESNLSMAGRVGEYVKIGRIVHIIGGGICGNVSNQSTSKALSFSNLPFAMVNTGIGATGHPFPVNTLDLDSTGLANMVGSQPYVFRGRLNNNSDSGRIVGYRGDSNQGPQNASLAFVANSQIYCMFTYVTAS